MPELIEVENYRQLLLTLKGVDKTNNTSSPPSLLTFETPSPTPPKNFPSQSELKSLEKCFVEEVERKGKLLRLVLREAIDDTPSKPKRKHLYLHMGMTGLIATPNHIPSLMELKDTDDFPPPHTHLILKSNDKQVSFSDSRRFGAVSFGEPLSTQWEEFAPDALHPDGDGNVDSSSSQISSSSLMDKLIGCKKGVKALLLDQRAIVSGVGNWIADEILYQSEIHPDQNYLTSEEVHVLKETLDFVLKTGNECLAAKTAFPDDWIFHRRWSKGRGGDTPKDAKGRSITYLKSGGRTSAIVTAIQKKRSRKSTTIGKKVEKDDNSPRKTSKQNVTDKGTDRERKENGAATIQIKEETKRKRHDDSTTTIDSKKRQSRRLKEKSSSIK